MKKNTTKLLIIFLIIIYCFPLSWSKADVLTDNRTDVLSQQSTTGPDMPAEVILQDANKREDRLEDKLSERLINVPSYLWRHGCGPTAVGMVVGFFDSNGFPDLVPGDSWNQTDAVDQMMASGGKIEMPNPPDSRGHFEDYALPIDESPDMLPDAYISGGWLPHANNSIADFMYTSRSEYSNYYGWSWSNHIEDAFKSYVILQNNRYQPITRFFYNTSLSWSVLQSEIDKNRPMVFLVDSNSDGYTDHFVTVVGYRTSPTLQYGILDTWDNTKIRWENFEYIQAGTPWGIWGGWSFDIIEMADLGYETYMPIVFKSYLNPCDRTPVLLSPANQSIISTLVPEFDINAPEWELVDNVQLQISETSNFSSIFEWWNLFPEETITIRVIDNLTEDQTYYWRTRYVCDGEPGAWSSPWQFVAPSGGTKPDVPLLISPTDGTVFISNNVLVDWSDVDGVDSYMLITQYSDQPYTRYYQIVNDSNAYIYANSGITVTWWVRSFNGYAYSEDSPHWSFTIQATGNEETTKFDTEEFSYYEMKGDCYLLK